MPPKYVNVRLRQKTAEELFGIKPTPAKPKTVFYQPPPKAASQYRSTKGKVVRQNNNNTFKVQSTPSRQAALAAQDALMYARRR